MVSEISQTEKDKYSMLSLILESKNKLVNITKQKQTHRYREQTSGSHWGEGQYWGRGLRDTNNYV